LQFVQWPSGETQETALVFDDFRRWRLLIVPALFDESNRMRRFTVEVMRRLNNAGVDCILPDLPGMGESLAPLEAQTPETWRAAVAAAAKHFRASHVLGIRGGALLLPEGLPGWRYAPQNGANALRQMMRARIMSSREAGIAESQEGLLAVALEGGIELVGYRLGAEFIRQYQSLTPMSSPVVSDIDQDMVGSGGLWLRAEPSEDRAQADALAAILAIGIKS
jgi:pimeloyl-ACP methyl ester carboxylesterase